MSNPATVSYTCRGCANSFDRDKAARVMYCLTCKPKRVRDKQTRRRSKNSSKPFDPNDSFHGTVNGYTNYGCRCDRCCEAQRVYHASWRTRTDRPPRLHYRTPEQVFRIRAKRYGLTSSELQRMLDRGQCDACGTTDPGFHGWSVDHDHACCTGKNRACGKCVRGILCGSCNKALGLVEDDITRLESLADYLERWHDRASQ